MRQNNMRLWREGRRRKWGSVYLGVQVSKEEMCQVICSFWASPLRQGFASLHMRRALRKG